MELAEIKRGLAALKEQPLLEMGPDAEPTKSYRALLKRYQDLLEASANQKNAEVERDFEVIRRKLDIEDLPFFAQAAPKPAVPKKADDAEEEADDVNEIVGKFFDVLGQLSDRIEAMERVQTQGNLIAQEAPGEAFEMLDYLQKKRKEYLDDCKTRRAKPEHLEVDGQLEVMEAQLVAITEKQEELVQSFQQRSAGNPSFSAAVHKPASAVPYGAICAPEDMRKALEQVYQVPANKIKQHGSDNIFQVDYSSSNNAPKTVIFNLAANQPKHSVEFQEDSTLEDYVKAAIILRAAGQRFNFDDRAMQANPKMKALCIQASQIVGLELKGQDLSCDLLHTNAEEYRQYAGMDYEEMVKQAADTMKRQASPRRSEVDLESLREAESARAGLSSASMFSQPSARREERRAPAPGRVTKD